MFHVALDGLWLVGALVAAALVGVFVSQYIKDSLKGVPSALRTALSATESTALAALKEAEAAVVKEFAKKVSPAATAAAATVPVIAVSSVAKAVTPAPLAVPVPIASAAAAPVVAAPVAVQAPGGPATSTVVQVPTETAPAVKV
jgi:hypothetical protein